MSEILSAVLFEGWTFICMTEHLLIPSLGEYQVWFMPPGFKIWGPTVWEVTYHVSVWIIPLHFLSRSSCTFWYGSTRVLPKQPCHTARPFMEVEIPPCLLCLLVWSVCVRDRAHSRPWQILREGNNREGNKWCTNARGIF